MTASSLATELHLVCAAPEEDSDDQEVLEFGRTYGLIGQSPIFLELLKTLRRFSPFSQLVLLRGETGTGKELCAQALHGERGGRFIAVNCGSLVGEMAKVEAFGYRRSSFSGSDRVDRDGFFVGAKGGTLFLDEAQLLQLDLQPHFLRALQEFKVKPVGAQDEVTVCDVRVVVASNEDLQRMVNEGKLRIDLYHRLNVLSVNIPPLRKRLDDIPLLVDHFLQKHRIALDSSVEAASPEAIVLLQQYNWPGNVRELENIIISILARKEGELITDNDIRTVLPASADLPEPTAFVAQQIKPLENYFKDAETMESGYAIVEQLLLRRTLAKYNGNQTKASEILDISRATLRTMMKKYDMHIARSVAET